MQSWPTDVYRHCKFSLGKSPIFKKNIWKILLSWQIRRGTFQNQSINQSFINKLQTCPHCIDEIHKCSVICHHYWNLYTSFPHLQPCWLSKWCHLVPHFAGSYCKRPHDLLKVFQVVSLSPGWCGMLGPLPCFWCIPAPDLNDQLIIKPDNEPFETSALEQRNIYKM